MKHCFDCHVDLPVSAPEHNGRLSHTCHVAGRYEYVAGNEYFIHCEKCFAALLADYVSYRSRIILLTDLDFGEEDDRLERQAERYATLMEAQA